MSCTEPLCRAQAGASVNLTTIFNSSALGVWRRLRIPLACWTTAGADLRDVEVPFAVSTTGAFGLTLAEVRLASKPMRSGRALPMRVWPEGARTAFEWLN